MNFLAQVDALDVVVDEELRESDYDGLIYWGRPTKIHLAPDPELAVPELLLHECAHFIAIWRWRDAGHGRRFKQCLKELKEV